MLRTSFTALAVLLIPGVPPLLAQQIPPAPGRTPTEQARLDEGPLVGASNSTAVELFTRFPASAGNIACSPYALTETLALVSSGAKGQTRAELNRALPPLGEARLQNATLTLKRDLDADTPPRPERMLRSGTGLWPGSDTEFNPGFLALARNYYPEGLNSAASGGKVRPVPADLTTERPVLATAPEATPAALLVSDVGFKGLWAIPFAKGETRDEYFTLANGSKVPTAMMHQTGTFRYGETPDLQVVELPYQDRDLQFLLLLPRRTDGLADLQKNLTLDRLARVTSGLSRREVAVALPRFQVVLHLKLRSELESLGIRQVFTPQAQLTGLTADNKPTRLDQVLQAVSFEVDEGVGPQSSLPLPIPDRQTGDGPTRVRADHPFLFVVKDASRGGIVFIGRLSDPTTPSKK